MFMHKRVVRRGDRPVITYGPMLIHDHEGGESELHLELQQHIGSVDASNEKIAICQACPNLQGQGAAAR